MLVGISFATLVIYACFRNVIAIRRVDLLTEELRSLSELPMDRLIQLKMSLIDDDVNCTNNSNEESSMESRSGDRSTALSIPAALPLRRSSPKKSIRRHEEHWDDRGKDSKISKIFQLTLTALSFLAFGGYLLTLIITTIRRNQNNATPTNVVVFSSLANLQKYARPKRQAWPANPMENELDEDRMYQGMLMLARCYAEML